MIDENFLTDFKDDVIIVDPGNFAYNKNLFWAFQSWYYQNYGEKSRSIRGHHLSDFLKIFYQDSVDSEGIRGFRNIGVKPEWMDGYHGLK